MDDRFVGVVVSDGLQQGFVTDLVAWSRRKAIPLNCLILLLSAAMVLLVFMPEWRLDVIARIALCAPALILFLGVLSSVLRAKQGVRTVIARSMPVGSRVAAYLDSEFLRQSGYWGRSEFRLELYSGITLSEHCVFMKSGSPGVSIVIPRLAFTEGDPELLQNYFENRPQGGRV